MDKITFNKITLLDQITFINDELKKGNTLSKISENINISRKTIGKPLIRAGYKFDKNIKQYIKADEYKYNTSILELVKTPVTKAIKPHEYKPNINIFNNKDAENKILDIIEKHDNIQEMLEWYNNQKNVIEVDLNELKINSDKLHGEIKTTTVRLYNEVWEGFRSFMEGYKEYKSMDLISMALVEYMDRYKK